jgi:glycosidase/fibronectin type 3 domain-containing protein
MRTLSDRIGRILLCSFFVFSILAPGLSAPAQALVPSSSQSDRLSAPPPGLEPAAVDPLGDMTEHNLDLHRLWVWEDASSYYIAFDAFASIWGMAYGIYIDTDQVSGSGSTSDPWGRNVNAVPEHLPEYTLYVWHFEDDTLENAQLNRWTGSSWTFDSLVSQGGSQTYLPAEDYLEYRVPKTALGNPAAIAIEVFTTGGGGHAQDTVPSDPNVAFTEPDWSSTPTTLSAFYVYPPDSLTLQVSSPPDGFFTSSPQVAVAGSVSPTVGVVVTIDVNGDDTYTPVLTPQGAFSHDVSLIRGANTITVTATDGTNTVSAVRHVSFGGSHDNNILWDYLGHDSRLPVFRTPGGPVEAGTVVTLRLHAASGDLTGAKVRIWNDRTDTQILRSMTRVADDGVYEWWEAAVPASLDPTVYWYRFLAIDGTKTVYYEDDAARDGGWGQPFDSSPDNSWQLTVYHPDFYTPDWVKNAVIYQIFPDRFRDGDPSNNNEVGDFFYDEPGGTIYRSNMEEWNTYICDPREAGTSCTGSYSKNFYGGDLQGILDKLDYLQDLGVTALYMNPIFESPSNHKYDTADFGQIDDNLGDLALFESLAAQASSRGISLILDGVFNHSSSDSIYFDRYGNFQHVIGACESPASPYRDWYYFTDVAPGTGPCAGSDGTPKAANYESWWGYDSLPKLRAHNPQVRDYIWSGGENSIGRYWMETDPQRAMGWRLDVAGDVDPGVLVDPNNTYWEGFRQAVRETNPEAYIVGEEWGYPNSWILGEEWDASMNYLFSTALLGFWRETAFYDNDHNDGSSAGPILPLKPEQFVERMLDLQERFAPEAFYAMMNLLGSHDTSRALFMLDHNADQNNDSLYLNPAYDWSDAIQRLKGVALMQMTLPGAPTIYYGDEVGLVGPPRFMDYGGGNAKWEDDPYNRQPYPWLDEGGTPFYQHLQSQASQEALFSYYSTLTGARNTHPALRTGSFDPMLVDSENNLLAYGRKLDDHSDAAIVLVNRGDAVHPAIVDVSGYLPVGAQFQDIFSLTVYQVSASGLIQVSSVPANSGLVLVLSGSMAAPPAEVQDLTAIEGNGEVSLSWSPAAGADSYNVYRSMLSRGGFVLIGSTNTASFIDPTVENGRLYYYVVESRSDSTLLVSMFSNEVNALPHVIIDWANLQWPAEITHMIGLEPTENIYGQVYIAGVTELPGVSPGLRAQVGYGPADEPPSNWDAWVEAVFNDQFGNNDEFAAQLIPEETGTFAYAYRYTTTGGREWVYADLDGLFDGSQLSPNPGALVVEHSEDIIPPAAPQNLRLEDWGADFLKLAWDPVTGDPTLYAYDLFRSTVEVEEGTRVARILAPATAYIDTDVETGQIYYYRVRAVDTSFNRSNPSSVVAAMPEAKIVQVKFRVRVPNYTPGTVYLVGDAPGLASWNPGALPMTQVSPDIWEITRDMPDGMAIQYKYTRASWDTVESWGTITGFTNRHAVILYEENGQQLIDNTATDWGTGPDDGKAVQDWRDPIVVSHSPANGAAGVPTNTIIQVTWSHAMAEGTRFSVTGPAGEIEGSFSYDSGSNTSTFVPSQSLEKNSQYRVTVSGQQDAGGGSQQVPVTFTFTTLSDIIPTQQNLYLPLLYKK